ncbi:hypothetical protein DFQ26_004788 [Actinomortierella ambigua]|nr:hypothetical protein DFQ26_004788 [Actinomortierella ambigua]
MDSQLQAHVRGAVQEHATEHASTSHQHHVAQPSDSQIGLSTFSESTTLTASATIASSSIPKSTRDDDVLGIDGGVHHHQHHHDHHHSQAQNEKTTTKTRDPRDVLARRLARATRRGWDDGDYDDDEDDDDDDDDEDDDEKNARRRHDDRRRGRRRRRRHLPTANELLHRAPAIPDMRFDHNYNKALDHLYEVHAHELQVARARLATALAIDQSGEGDDESSSSHPPSQPAKLSSAALARLTLDQQRQYTEDLQRYRDYQDHQRRLRRETTVASLPARIAVMTVRDIIIMPFVHGFFWGIGTVVLGIVAKRGLAHYFVQAWRRCFPPSSKDHHPPLPVIRGEPARIRRPGSVGLGLGIGGGGGSPPSAAYL